MYGNMYDPQIAGTSTGTARQAPGYGGAAAATGGSLLGSILTGLGAQQGSQALGKQLQLEQGQQEALQQQSDQNMGTFLGNNQPAQAAQLATAQSQGPAQAYLQKLGSYQPQGLAPGAAATIANNAGASANALQSANARFGREQGQTQANRQMQIGQQNLGVQQGELQLQNRRDQELYGLQEAQAAAKGSGLRTLGGLTSAASPALGLLGR